MKQFCFFGHLVFLFYLLLLFSLGANRPLWVTPPPCLNWNFKSYGTWVVDCVLCRVFPRSWLFTFSSWIRTRGFHSPSLTGFALLNNTLEKLLPKLGRIQTGWGSEWLVKGHTGSVSCVLSLIVRWSTSVFPLITISENLRSFMTWILTFSWFADSRWLFTKV